MPLEVIVFAKAPVPGRVKTRLAGELGAERAVSLYRAFVHDLLAGPLAAPDFDVTLCADPDPEVAFFQDLAKRHGVALEAQGDGGLGARMGAALHRRITCSGAPAVLIGTDFPTLPADHLRQAGGLLSRHELVFGPSNDGGYYLIGASPSALERWDRVTERCLGDLPWSTPEVLRETLTRAGDLDVALGPVWYDVDEPGDLELLSAHLRGDGTVRVPDTRALLGEWGRL